MSAPGDIGGSHAIPEGDMIDATSKLQLEAAEVRCYSWFY